MLLLSHLKGLFFFQVVIDECWYLRASLNKHQLKRVVGDCAWILSGAAKLRSQSQAAVSAPVGAGAVHPLDQNYMNYSLPAEMPQHVLQV